MKLINIVYIYYSFTGKGEGCTYEEEPRKSITDIGMEENIKVIASGA